ncbi:hypothetical protein [Massilia phyllosphaerae]|uniref:hypothetical protein n=1 Tax=Massilia phyllosphaerae TaxID=3106034 RepID=UPI002B1CC066|nr:hypothetical protein [Massilia sp. SGZ-792]
MTTKKFEAFAHILREVLSHDAGKLFDFQLALMQREIGEGWWAFYSQEILFKDLLPAPLINELGRQYAVENLRCEIWRDVSQSAWRGFGQANSNYHSVLLTQWTEQPEALAEYRNFLDVGALDTSMASTPDPLDRTANSVLRHRIETEHKHWLYELEANATDSYVEAAAQGVLTPPLIVRELAPATPLRDMSEALADDTQYWRAVHQERWRVAMNANEFKAFTKPDENLRLMAALAPDFPYAAHLSSAKRLVFVQQGDGPLAWALMIDKTDGSTTYRYPPKLILINRAQTKKLKDDDILYMNVIGKSFVSHIDGARCLETELLFHLPRSRRLIAFYAPFVQQALSRVGS